MENNKFTNSSSCWNLENMAMEASPHSHNMIHVLHDDHDHHHPHPLWPPPFLPLHPSSVAPPPPEPTPWSILSSSSSSSTHDHRHIHDDHLMLLNSSNNNNNNNKDHLMLLNSNINNNNNNNNDRHILLCEDHNNNQEVDEEEEEEELGAMKEMMYKIAAMQPVDIDPATIRKPKRRNVRISDDPQSVAARHRRERISEKIRILQRLVPGGTKMDTASMLDEAIRYVKFLKRQIRHLQSNPSSSSAAAAVVLGFRPPLAHNHNMSLINHQVIKD